MKEGRGKNYSKVCFLHKKKGFGLNTKLMRLQTKLGNNINLQILVLLFETCLHNDLKGQPWKTEYKGSRVTEKHQLKKTIGCRMHSMKVYIYKVILSIV